MNLILRNSHFILTEFDLAAAFQSAKMLALRCSHKTPAKTLGQTIAKSYANVICESQLEREREKFNAMPNDHRILRKVYVSKVIHLRLISCSGQRRIALENEPAKQSRNIRSLSLESSPLESSWAKKYLKLRFSIRRPPPRTKRSANRKYSRKNIFGFASLSLLLSGESWTRGGFSLLV